MAILIVNLNNEQYPIMHKSDVTYKDGALYIKTAELQAADCCSANRINVMPIDTIAYIIDDYSDVDTSSYLKDNIGAAILKSGKPSLLAHLQYITGQIKLTEM